MLSFAAALFLAGSIAGLNGRLPLLGAISAVVLIASLALTLVQGASVLAAAGTAGLGLIMLQAGFVAAIVYRTAEVKLEEARIAEERGKQRDRRLG